MNHYTIIEKLERERVLCLQWVEKVRDIIVGEKINNEYLPIDTTSFSFDYLFSTQINEVEVKQLELKYKKIHDMYRKVFLSYFEIKKYSYEGEFKYKVKSVTEEDKVEAMEDLVFLEAISKEFTNSLQLLEAKQQQELLEHCLEKAS